MKIRINKFLSSSGITSRRNADKLLKMGLVSINDQIIKTPGIKVDPDLDTVRVGKKTIKPKTNIKKVYYILNKPVGYVCTTKDKFNKKLITHLTPKNPRVYPVGRLDKDSEGLIILTNDGDFTQKITHPSFNHEKEYVVTVSPKNKQHNPQSIIDIIQKGIRLEEGIAKFDKIKLINAKNNTYTFSVILHQGWNRQIRRMFTSIGYEVSNLKRIRINKLKLENLSSGKYRKILPNEVI